MNRFTIFVSLAAASALTGCKSKMPATMLPLELPVATAECRDVPQTITFTGETFGKADVSIPARVNGFLRAIYFKEGAYVRRGQPLYLIEPDTYEAQTVQRRAAVAQAEASLTDAGQNYERIKPLAALHAASVSDLDQATSELHTAEASLESARAALKCAQIEESYTAITSPVDGVIGFTKAEKGDYVGPGSTHETLNTVSEIDTIHVVFFIPEQVYTRALSKRASRLNDLGLVLSDGKEFPQRGRFDFVGRAVVTGTGSFDAQASFPNPQRRLRPGLFARITTTADTLHNAVLVPQTAVVRTQNSFSVYVLDSTGHVEQRIVSMGDTYNNMWIIRSGLREGERVITAGFHKLRDGVIVKPEQSPTAK